MKAGVYLADVPDHGEALIGLLVVEHLPRVGDNLVIDGLGNGGAAYRVVDVHTVVTPTPTEDHPTVATLRDPRYFVMVEPGGVIIPPSSAWG